jgi:phosphate transport system protein
MTTIQFSGHAFTRYDILTQQLLEELQRMASEVRVLLDLFSETIQGKQTERSVAKQIDKQINQTERDVITQLHSILGQYSPSIDELRFLTATVRIASGLERMGDIAKVNIWRCEELQTGGNQFPEGFAEKIEAMITHIRDMLARAMKNLTELDKEALISILQQDDQVNQHYHELMNALYRLPKQHPLLPVIIKNVERAADHVFDMVRVIHYAHTGHTPKKKQIRKGEI